MSNIQAIAHRLTRCVGEQSFSLSETVFTEAELNRALLSELKGVFNRRASKRYGRFADEGTAFKGLVLNFLDSAIDFKSFSSKVLEQLAMMIEHEDIETDGHWVFLLEEMEGRRYLWVASLLQRDGLALNSDNNLLASGYIDFAKSGICFRIDLDDVQLPDQQRFITLSFGFGDRALQGAMMSFVGFMDTVDTTADTERFMEAVKQYSASMPEENSKRFQKEAAEFCIEQSSQGESVSYKDLADSVDSVASVRFDRFVAEEAPGLNDNFIPDRSALKKYIRYTGRTRDVSVSFSNESLGREISFDPENNTLTLKELPASLIKQLKGE